MDGDGITDTLDPYRDGDEVPNDEDAYPDDGEWWEEENVEEGGSAVWWVLGIVGAFVVLGIVVGVVVVGSWRKRDGVENVDGSGEDELGRIGDDVGESKESSPDGL